MFTMRCFATITLQYLDFVPLISSTCYSAFSFQYVIRIVIIYISSHYEKNIAFKATSKQKKVSTC